MVAHPKSPTQRHLPLPTPAGHHQAVHADQRAVALLWRQHQVPKWHKVRPGQPWPDLGPLNLFETPNEFRGWVQARLLHSLCACWVELDGHTHTNRADLLQRVVAECDDRHWPWPSLVIVTRNGCHLYWLLQPTPAEALPRWQAVQRRLHEAFSDLGSDPQGQKVTQVLRMAGSTHTKPEKAQLNPVPVEGYWLAPDPSPWQFSALADRILPYSQAELHDLQAQRAKRGKGQAPSRKGSIYEWWARVYQDLVAICEWHWWGGVPEGYRDRMLFLLSNALSWITHPEALEAEIIATARTWTPTLTQKETKTYTQPIVKRALDAAAGRRYEWPAGSGQTWDPRYHFRRETLRQWLNGLIPAELEPHLSGLASGEVLAQRKRERDRENWRKKHGSLTPSDRRERQSQARTMAQEGRTRQEIAEAFGVSTRTVRNWLNSGG